MLLKILKEVFKKVEDLGLEKENKQKMIGLMNSIFQQIKDKEANQQSDSSSIRGSRAGKGPVDTSFSKSGIYKQKGSTMTTGESGVRPGSSLKENLGSKENIEDCTVKNENKDIDLAYIYESYYPAHWMMHSTILSIAQLNF